MEADLVKRAGILYKAIPAAGIHGVGLRALPYNSWQLGRGVFAARRILKDFRPQALFFTGGYMAVPMALAGRKIPSALYVPDIEPGLALKTLARFARCIAVTAEESRSYFPGHPRVVVTGYPARPDLKTWDPEMARQVFDFTADLPVLLVSGGSKGARSINRALLAVLPQLLAEMQVIHISGQLDWPEVEQARGSLDAAQLARYRAYPYLHGEMGAALALADLAITRAGASSLGELPLFGLPAVLVPYPYAWRYQQVNAEYLARQGAAQVVADAELASRLLPAVQDLMRDPGRREQMRQAMQSLARPDAAQSIASLLFDMAGRGQR